MLCYYGAFRLGLRRPTALLLEELESLKDLDNPDNCMNADDPDNSIA